MSRSLLIHTRHTAFQIMAVLPFLIAFGLTRVLTGAKAYDGKEAWGYINIRPAAYMFWWLYYTDVAADYSNYPLVIWLQGGPGASSSGFGNFAEIGPLDVHLKPRNTCWVKSANLLFLDSPVGTGFSYVTDTSALATNNKQISDDLVTIITALMQSIPEFQKSPMYIVGESYGGKMAVEFALALYQAIKAEKVACNLKGVTLGDSWISPVDSVATWGPYLYTMSMLSKGELKKIAVEVLNVKKAMQSGQFVNATLLFDKIQDIIAKMTNGVDMYNVLNHVRPPPNPTTNILAPDHRYYKLYNRVVGRFYGDELSTVMNGPIKEKLHVIPKNVTWGGQSSYVLTALAEDFMKPVITSVDALLNETPLSVNVYNGQLDIMVATLGTLQWIGNLKWPDLKYFMAAPKVPMVMSKNYTTGFVTSFKNFRFFWILKSGHMVPSDAGPTALQMLGMILPSRK